MAKTIASLQSHNGTLNTFDREVQEVSGSVLTARDVTTVQVNVGLRCSNSCAHCHLEAGPARNEMMNWETMQLVMVIANQTQPRLVDITGGAPEINPLLPRFVSGLREDGYAVQVRTNLTALHELEMEKMTRFYANAGVKLIASLPCYTKANVDSQRGSGVYEKSIEVLKHLNAVGYGSDSGLELDLVYNPGGAFLPAEQSSLESAYKENLQKDHGIVFNNLITITNMPIGRFRDLLQKSNGYEQYKRLLKEAFNPQTLDGLMCLHQIEVAWDEHLYDCDFNLALHAPIGDGFSSHARDFSIDTYSKRRIVTGEHCYGCTAGHGSSCGGALIRSP